MAIRVSCHGITWGRDGLDNAIRDLRTLGFEPIAIETAQGRADYELHQRDFALRGEPLRARLIAACDWLLEERAAQ